MNDPARKPWEQAHPRPVHPECRGGIDLVPVFEAELATALDKDRFSVVGHRMIREALGLGLGCGTELVVNEIARLKRENETLSKRVECLEDWDGADTSTLETKDE